MVYYCGIDLGNKETTIAIRDRRKQVIMEESIETTEQGVESVFNRYMKLICIVEAAPMAEWFCSEVKKYGHEITIVCARKAKAVLSAKNLKKKTDKRDARGLAELCQSGWYESVHRKSEEARDMRSFLTARKQLVQCSLALASSIRGILRAHGIRLKGESDSPKFAGKARSAIEKLPDCAKQGVDELLKAFVLLHEQQRALYRKLEKHTKKNEITDLLMTHPGVGPATAAAFVATIDDPNRFADGEKVASYIGLTPSVYKSGDTEHYGSITKTGDKLLRWLLVESANILLTRSKSECGLRRWGLRLSEKKGSGKAKVAVARRLCSILWKMWKDRTEFNPEAMAA